MKLEDEVLGGVYGGVNVRAQGNGTANDNVTGDTVEKHCPVCNMKKLFKLYTGGRAVCTKCGYQINDA